MDKHKPGPREHHYVWAHYLRNWATGNKIWYVTRKGNIRDDSPTGLSREHGFNRISPLSTKDFFYMRHLAQTGNALLDRFLKSELLYFFEISQDIGCHLGQETSPKYNELKQRSETIEYEVFEKTHTLIENGARSVLDQLASGDPRALETSENRIGFFNYLAQQLVRTKGIKSRYNELSHSVNNSSILWEDFSSSIRKHSWLYFYLCGFRLGLSLIQNTDNERIFFLTNTTYTPFITSDFPVVNIHDSESLRSRGEPPSQLDLYYPISPTYAIIISAEGKYEAMTYSLSNEEVLRLNSIVARMSQASIYGSTEQSIKENKSAFNKRLWRDDRSV